MSAQASQTMSRQPGLPDWLSQRWLNRMALLLVLLGLLSLLVVKLADPNTLPVRKIRVQGALAYIDEAMLHRAIDGKVNGGFFNLNVSRIREALEQLPWVQAATVRKVWPDSIVLSVQEQVPLAHWAAGGLVNTAGEVFRPVAEPTMKNLPQFSAPPGRSAALSQLYHQFNRQLVPTGLHIRRIRQNARRAVRLQLNNGILLVLGREHQRARLQRFARVYVSDMLKQVENIKRVDLRYSKGMAVQWHSKIEPKQG